MATLIFSALGTLVGGPLGGVIGALAGQQVDAAIIGGRQIEGPRLKDLSVTTSSYGEPLPRHFGQMRVAGSVIWATELVEHSQTSGGGKGKPSVTSYSYSTSFAVALASRPINGIGRIWADGKLLRGSAGDLKVGGTLRLYTGTGDQPVDTLIAASEGASGCPAFRGIAYVVFENLQLGDFGNRIPALTFEIFAGSGEQSVAMLFDGVIDEVDAEVPLTGVQGYTCAGSIEATLRQFQPIFPMDCDAAGEQLVVAPGRRQSAPIALSEAAASADRHDFGRQAGFARRRGSPPIARGEVLRYYDLDRDYQPATQRAPGLDAASQPATFDLPASLTATGALDLISRCARTVNWAGDTLAWRTTVLDPSVAPGSLVTVPGHPGQWRVTAWEWRQGGVELSLERTAPALGASGLSADAGQARVAADLAITPTVLKALELPWDGNGSNATTTVLAAASSSGAGWQGASLFIDQGDGQLQPLDSATRRRATIGTAMTALAAASPSLVDRGPGVVVSLVGTDLALAPASMRQLANGANRALLGSELIQFSRCQALGAGQWRLTGLLRGRGGTEAAIGGHVAGEAFVLLDNVPVGIDAARIGSGPNVRVAAMGLADATAVESDIACRGASLRPLSPVHPTAQAISGGGLILGWCRRARGAWQWSDSVEVPLQEQSEAYLVSFGPSSSPVASWMAAGPSLTLTATDITTLRAALPSGRFSVRQQGTYALSDALDLGPLP